MAVNIFETFLENHSVIRTGKEMKSFSWLSVKRQANKEVDDSLHLGSVL